MKIYTKVKIGIASGEVLEEESYQYYGYVDECKGGGGGGGTPYIPPIPPPPPPPPPEPPTEEDEEVQRARIEERRRLMGMRGRRSTILTGPMGLEKAAPVQQKTLLGQ